MSWDDDFDRHDEWDDGFARARRRKRTAAVSVVAWLTFSLGVLTALAFLCVCGVGTLMSGLIFGAGPLLEKQIARKIQEENQGRLAPNDPQVAMAQKDLKKFVPLAGGMALLLTALVSGGLAIFATGFLASGWGLFYRRNWARVMTLVFVGLLVLTCTSTILFGRPVVAAVLSAGSLSYAVFALVVLLHPDLAGDFS